MSSSFNLLLTILFTIGSILLLKYFFKLRDKGHKAEILEIKLKALQRKINEEKSELLEVQNRLEQQKNPLEKKWQEIQEGEKILETKASRLQQDRELLERQKYEIEQYRIKIEESQRKIDAVQRQLKIKWQHESQEIENNKNELRKVLSQMDQEQTNIDLQQHQINKDQQYLADEKRKIAKKTKQFEILKIYFENQNKEALEEKRKQQNEENRIKEERKKLEQDKEAIKIAKKELIKQLDNLVKREAELTEIEQVVENEKEQLQYDRAQLQKAELNFENLLRRMTIQTLHQIRQIQEKSKSITLHSNGELHKQHISSASAELMQRDIILETHCWKRNKIWYFGLKVIHEQSIGTCNEIRQENDLLAKSDLGDNLWILNSFSPVALYFSKADETIELRFNIVPAKLVAPLLFKLHTPDKGKLTKYPSTGTYLMLVPADWQPDGQLAVESVDEKETILLNNFKTFKINLRETSNSLIVFRKPDEELICLAQQRIRFCLDKTNSIQLQDEAEPLFGVKFPRVIDREQSWNDIGTIMISDQMGKYQTLVKSPFPLTTSKELDLNHIKNRGEDAIDKIVNIIFILDIYDRFNVLLESISFKYLDNLQEIKIDDYPILPGSSGHAEISVHFIHDQGCEIGIASNEATGVALRSDDKGTVATISPIPALDITRWLVRDSQNRQLSLTTRLNRIWWQLANHTKIPEKNHAKDIPIKISSFNSGGEPDLGVYIWLPEQYNDKFLIGFEKNRAKAYSKNANESGIFISMNELFNETGGVNLTGSQQLKIWLDKDKEDFSVILDLMSQQYSCKVKDCDFKTTNKDEMKLHIRQKHLTNLVEELSYQEIRSSYKFDLPDEIYQCGYCKGYIFSDQKSDNPVSSIINHISQCPNAHSQNGNPFLSFRIVKNLQELKNSVLHEIPLVSKCHLCEKHFQNPCAEELMNHLVQLHEKDLIGEPREDLSKS